MATQASRGYTPNGDLVSQEQTPYSVVWFGLAARTATPATNGVALPSQASAVMISIVTTASAAPSTIFAIDGYDPATDTYFNLATSAAVVGNGTTILRVYPGAVPVANVGVDNVVPRVIRVTATHGNGNSHTYGVSIHFSQA